jgi:phenylacetate-CoA ligase
MLNGYYHRREAVRESAASRPVRQLEQLNAMLQRVLPHNRFYATKFDGIPLPLATFDAFLDLPFTTKEELVSGPRGRDGHSVALPDGGPTAMIAAADAGFARNLTYPLERYVRYHRTSGTRGRPLVVLDTAEDWQWWLDGWQFVLDAAQITAGDRVVLAFSFGPFIGFWTAFDAVTQRGALVAPTGGMSTLARLDTIRSLSATAVFCTPSYALRMAEVAVEERFDLRRCGVKTLVVAGEPGGSAAATRQRLEESWGARVIDHAGASEVGPWGFASTDQAGLHINDNLFIAELLRPGSREPAAPGELAELVLTSLGRAGCPVIRYRTGDLVRWRPRPDLECQFTFLDGGVLGRADDMLIIRGVNIFPSSIESIIRELHHVAEYRLTARRQGTMDALVLEVEDHNDNPQTIANLLQVRLGLSVEVRAVAPGSLPRFEGKGRRFIDERPDGRCPRENQFNVPLQASKRDH